ncbi:MAG: UDP-N-acetylmuramoyl-tripeptide--D-alanyl-D-alanine ligase [Hyphomicrobium sp.]|nr:UDP-N-acetylmuramoyl-tripeptide--D-alanyl-D-alanine ligase [Hyphomicrobium sp.]
MADDAPLWTWDALVAAAEGRAEGAPANAITGFSIDTRSLAPGEIFVALTDQRDGHEFVCAAFERGAAAALVRTDFVALAGVGALIRVDDPLSALGCIAVAARARLRSQARVIAVTGSAGKTGTKEMLRACLATAGKVHAPEKSFNNHWGVPLTLARMPADVDFAMIEIGMNHAGEISPLTRMARPHIAVVTNVLPVHVGNFADGEAGVARAKAEIFEGLEPGGIAVLPRDSKHYALLSAAATARGARVVTFGTTTDAYVGAREIRLGDTGSEIIAEIGSDVVRYKLGTVGVHIAVNSLAVIATLDALHLRLDKATVPLAGITPPVGRGARTVLKAGDGAILLIDEGYNANPASMRAAIAVLGAVSRENYPRRVAVMGDMLELGEGAEAYHLDLADALAAAEVDAVFACGPNMRKLYEALPQNQRGACAPDSAALIEHVVGALQPGDVVMVKGSLGSRMAPIVAAIKARFGAG